MKTLHTKNNWSPILTILILAIVSFAFILPNEKEKISSDAILDIVLNEDIFIQKEAIDNSFEIIDIRNKEDFEVGHIPNAQNIYISTILSKEHQQYFSNIQKEGKLMVLVGNETTSTIPAFKLLYQSGYTNLKIGTVKQMIRNNKIHIENEPIDQTPPNIQEFINTSIKRAEIIKEKPQPPIKKRIPVTPKKKKKKLPIEGGC